MAIYFFYGEEDFNIDIELHKLRSKLNPDFLSMSYHVYDNPGYQELVSALRTPPMMFGEMLVVINSEKYFLSGRKSSDDGSAEGGKGSFDDKQLEDIEDALKNNPETLNIVFVVKLPRDENKKIDSRRKLYKILSKYNTKEFPAFKTYKTAEIVGWIKNQAKTKEISIKDDAAELLTEQLGNDLRQMDKELDKLKLIAYPEKTVTRKMVGEIAVSNEDLFNLTDYIMKNQRGKALLEFRRLLDKKYPLEILSAIQTMLRKWILLKTKSSTSSEAELARLVGMHEFVVKQTLQKLKNISAGELVKLKENLFNVECKIKSADAIDIVSEVECAIIR